MKPQIVVSNNEMEWLEARLHDVTSTESAALFGLSPYITEFELWHRKRDRVVQAREPSDRMKWGTRLQDSIAKGIAEDQGWEIRRMDEYLRIPDLRMGASFDYAIGDEGLLEIKNVDSLIYKERWIKDEENLEAPPDVEIQVQQQLAVSDRKYAYIGALVGGNRVILIKREPSSRIIESLKEKIGAFWKSVSEGVAPRPDFIRDADFIAALYARSEPGSILTADDTVFNLALKYRAASLAEKIAAQEKDAVKAELLMQIGEAEKVFGDQFSISCGMVKEAEISFVRKPYRSFRIHWKKQKGEVEW